MSVSLYFFEGNTFVFCVLFFFFLLGGEVQYFFLLILLFKLGVL